LADFLRLEPIRARVTKIEITLPEPLPTRKPLTFANHRFNVRQMVNGNRICAMDWKRFINAADVTVSNRDHFLRR
jgi:hypothetical protein